MEQKFDNNDLLEFFLIGTTIFAVIATVVHIVILADIYLTPDANSHIQATIYNGGQQIGETPCITQDEITIRDNFVGYKDTVWLGDLLVEEVICSPDLDERGK